MLTEELKFPMLLTNVVGVVLCVTGIGDRENTVRGKVVEDAGNSGYERGETFESWSTRYYHPYVGSVLVDGVQLQNI